MKKKDIIQLVKDTINEVGAETFVPVDNWLGCSRLP